jgi:hypothetical protein
MSRGLDFVNRSIRGAMRFSDGSRRGVGLNIFCVGVWVRWRGASVAWWLGSRSRCNSEGWFSGGFSVCWLRSQYFFSVRDKY